MENLANCGDTLLVLLQTTKKCQKAVKDIHGSHGFRGFDESDDEFGPSLCPCCSSVFGTAIQDGHLAVLKWAWNVGYRICYMDVCYRAAQHGHLQILKWAFGRYPIKSNIYQAAALDGHVHILEWAQETGLVASEEDVNRMVESAIGTTHVPTLRWLFRVGHLQAEHSDIEQLMHNALCYGNWNAIELLHEQGCPLKEHMNCWIGFWSSYDEHIKQLVWDHLEGNEKHSLVMEAVEKGYVEVLAWAAANGHTIEEEQFADCQAQKLATYLWIEDFEDNL